MINRYKTDSGNLANRLVNVNKHIFGRVYFPVYSNRLKEIGHFIGAKWTSPNASGLQSLVWRYYWDETGRTEYKDILLTYNAEDCQALKLLIDELSKLKQSAEVLAEVDFANRQKKQATEVGKKIHGQFKAVLKFAYTDYDKKKITFRQDRRYESELIKKEKESSVKKGRPGYRTVTTKATKVIEIPQRNFCPYHKGKRLKPTEQISRRLIIDLVLMKSGIKKVAIAYEGVRGYCSNCGKTYAPPALDEYGAKNQLYGHGFKAWHVYHRVALRMPYESIRELVEEQFNERPSVSSITNFIRDFAQYYAETEEFIIQRLLNSPFIQVDETPINIRAENQYVWVFTDGKQVFFKLTETREAMIVHEVLADYKGILISDFYPGYDSVQCRQQKCWVHLIRDINNDLWTNPFDVEFEIFVLEVRNLIIPIMEAVQKYGLKRRNLNKFKKSVDKFYKRAITEKYYKSELALKYQSRFIKYQNSLFTFLEYDGIPWHNNTSENALRHLTVQEKISGSFFSSAMRHYLVLLGIRQTCRFQNKSFFKFLFSGETDINTFEARKRKRRV